jgi:hypothetical protein
MMRPLGQGRRSPVLVDFASQKFIAMQLTDDSLSVIND